MLGAKRSINPSPKATATTPERHRVVVIGSGFGGLTATKAPKHAPVDIKMIARTQPHLFQPLLYQVATGIISEGEIAPATRVILRKQANAQVLLGGPTAVTRDVSAFGVMQTVRSPARKRWQRDGPWRRPLARPSRNVGWTSWCPRSRAPSRV
jgi:hypothetical protein